jgi:hypothetical protein
LKKSSILWVLFAVVLPIALIILFSMDISDVFSGKYDYPFGTDSVGKYSIYSSKNIYIFHSMLQIFLLVIMIVLALKRIWKWYFAVFVTLLLVIYLPNFFR